jgi:hypothetical protein
MPSANGAKITNMGVETIASVIAAGGAVVAVYFARDTVKESITGRAEAARHHGEQIAAMQNATEAAAKQHQAEMDDRRKVALADAFDRQFRQLGEVIEMVLQIGNVARTDPRLATSPSVQVKGNPQIPSMLIALEGAITVLAALGVPNPPETYKLVHDGRNAGTAVLDVANMSVGALMALQDLATKLGYREPTDYR